MSGLVRGVVLLTALLLGINGASAQKRASDNSYYDTGGYLERPYANDDDGSQSAPPDTTESTRRPRKPRPEAPETLTQVPQIKPAQQGAGGSPSPQKQNTGTSRPTPETPRQNVQNESRPQPPRSASTSAEDGSAVIPPLPPRRPRLADVPRPAVTAMASPAPAPVEATPVREPVKPVENPPAAAEAPPPPEEEPVALHNSVVETPAPAEAPPAAEAEAERAGSDGQAAASEQPQPAEPAPASTAEAAPVEERPEADLAAAAPAQAPEPTPVPTPETLSPAPPVAEAPPPQVEPAQPTAPAVAEAAAAPAEPSTPANQTAAQPAAPGIDPDVLAELSPAGNPTVSEHQKGPAEEAAAPSVAPAPAAVDQPAPEMPAAPAPVAAASPAALPAEPVPAVKEPVLEPVAAAKEPAPEPAPAAKEPARQAPAAKQTIANLVTEAAAPVPQPPLRQNVALDKMIGQMLMVGFRGLAPEESWPQRLAEQIKAGTVGGVLFMSHNVQAPQQVRTLTGFLQRARGDIPPLLAVDQEGGIVQRLSPEKGFQEYPTAGKIGNTNDPLSAYGVYRRLAAELAQNGFNLNLGPVVDLLRNDASPIIAGKERSFGPQPKHVAAFAKAFIVAHQDEGILTVLKHFPGHGSTPFDTHVQAVDVGRSWDAAEIEPYRDLIASKSAQAVMVGHIAHPAMAEEAGMPASLSAKAIRKTLRGDLGFGGVVISDDLEMGAIRERYSIAESAVKAIKAGNDIIILSNQNAPSPDLPERVATAIRKAVETGVLRREDLEASYDRILNLKQRLQTVPAAQTPTANKRASADRGKTNQAR